MFKPVGSVLNSLPLGNKQRGAILAIRVRLAAQKVIDRQAGDLPSEILKSIKVTSYKNGVLTICCAPPLVSAELSMRSSGLKKEINEALGGRVVEKIRFRVG